jgi:hypothetical protein
MLRPDAETLKVQHVNWVTFETSDFHVERHRTEEREPLSRGFQTLPVGSGLECRQMQGSEVGNGRLSSRDRLDFTLLS